MKDLITALMIFNGYIEDDDHAAIAPTHCEHDVLYVMVQPRKVDHEDTMALAQLGFIANETEENFYSYRFGSA